MLQLPFALDAAAKTPLYEQLYRALVAQIRGGALPAGSRLPGKRTLAGQLGVAVNTVDTAYQILAAEGYLEARPRSGFVVQETWDPAPPAAVREPEARPAQAPRRWRFDLSTGGVDTALFPFRTWGRMQKELLYAAPELLGHGHPQGDENLRQAIAGYLAAYRGVDCSPDQIVVGAGTEYLLGLVAGLFRGAEAAVENPGYRRVRTILENNGLTCRCVPIDDSGLDAAALTGSAATLCCVTPSHHFPTAVTMPAARRGQLLRWASERPGRYLIEDDYDSEFRYKGKPIPALQGMDARGKVIYLGTFSRSVAPAIRLSYMVLPASLLDIYEKKNRFIHSTVSKVDQRIMERFLEEGYYERHLNKMRALYRGRHDALIEALKPLSGICRISGEHAGVHLLLHFGKEISEEERILQAKEAGIRVYGLSDYRIRPAGGEEPAILLGYANLTEEEIKKAVELLIRCWQ